MAGGPAGRQKRRYRITGRDIRHSAMAVLAPVHGSRVGNPETDLVAVGRSAAQPRTAKADHRLAQAGA